MSHFFTSESVSEGHPDKICDQISDAILEDIIAHDKHGRVACETFCATGLVLVGGEITTSQRRVLLRKQRIVDQFAIEHIRVGCIGVYWVAA